MLFLRWIKKKNIKKDKNFKYECIKRIINPARMWCDFEIVPYGYGRQLSAAGVAIPQKFTESYKRKRDKELYSLCNVANT